MSRPARAAPTRIDDDPAVERVLVTGAQGLLGREVVAQLLRGGVTAVLGVGRSARTGTTYTHDLRWLGRPIRAPLPFLLRQVELDCRYAYQRLDLADHGEVDEVVRGFRPDVVVHVAGALRDSSWPQLAASNLNPVVALLEAAATVGRPRVVLTSSGSVYGDIEASVPLHETDSLRPTTLYGVSKRAGEDLARVLARQHDLSVVSARVFNLLGPGLSERHLPAVLANLTTAARAGLGPAPVRVGPLTATRDFVDVRDAARALVGLARCRDTPAEVNVASGVETPVRDVATTITALRGGAVEVVEAEPPRHADISRSVADVARMRALGMVPRHGLTESLETMLTYYEALPTS